MMKNVFLLPVLALLISCTHVDAGHVGVEIDSCEGGGVSDKPVGVGYHTTGPCTDIVEYPTYQQTLLLAKPRDPKSNEEDDSIIVTSSEGLAIGVDVSLSFTVDPKKAPSIYQKFRVDLKHVMSSYMRQGVREAMQEVFAKYTAQQLYSDKREIARSEVQALLSPKLMLDGFIVTQFTVNETRIPPEVEQAIRNKVAMMQEAQRAEQAVKKTEAEARQAVAQAHGAAEAATAAAEGEAAVIKLRADAQAAANKTISESLTPELIEYEKAKKWNGQLPQVSGSGAVPMLQVK